MLLATSRFSSAALRLLSILRRPRSHCRSTLTRASAVTGDDRLGLRLLDAAAAAAAAGEKEIEGAVADVRALRSVAAAGVSWSSAVTVMVGELVTLLPPTAAAGLVGVIVAGAATLIGEGISGSLSLPSRRSPSASAADESSVRMCTYSAPSSFASTCSNTYALIWSSIYQAN